MRIVRGLESYPSDARESAVALGVFDGVHLGHRAILAAAVAEARRHGLVAHACTLVPHPHEALPPTRTPVPLTPLPNQPAPLSEKAGRAAGVHPVRRASADLRTR